MNEQVSSAWGDPNKVQQFRTQALQQGMGIKQVDDYVAQMQQAYQTQAGQQVQGAIGQNQGALTPNQAQQNPVGALKFLGNGGQLVNTGADAQAKFISDAQKTLTKAKGKNKYVDPNIYNSLKEQFGATGGDESVFDNKFDQYTDPNKVINYNTPEGRANQKAFGEITRQIQSQIDQYHAIPSDQRTLLSKGALADIPIINQFLAPQATSYENNRKALAGQLSGIVGGGPGSGLRVTNQDMDRWAKLLPSTINTSTVNDQNLQSLNDQIKAKFNVSTGINQHYLPSKGRPSLASFNQ